MRRGYSLENQIDKIIGYVNDSGGQAHKNHAQRTADGLYISGEPFDYEIFFNNKVMCFDAKECKQERWNLANAKLTQVKHLNNCKACGCDSFFLVYFYNDNKLVKFDVTFIVECMKNQIKSLPSNQGVIFDVRKELGINAL